MFFSPITERSLGVRLFYGFLFVVLSLGSLSMILPFWIMVSGSVETTTRFSDSTFFPRYLVENQALWQRYLEAKYHGNPDFLRMAWNDPLADFRTVELPASPTKSDEYRLELWEEFLREHPASPSLETIGFLRATTRLPAYNAREFRIWLLKRYEDDLQSLNRDLNTQFGNIRQVIPPNSSLIGPAALDSPLRRVFMEFSSQVPDDRHFAWDAGGYYRAVYLPRMLGHDVSAFNARFGTDFSSYAEVPFTSTVPTVAPDLWLEFVTRVLRPDLVSLTESADVRRLQVGQTVAEFLPLHAKPEDIRVSTLDRLFADWSAQREGREVLIPQRERDFIDFQKNSGFWKRTFFSLNYLVVIDEILINGRAVFNTFTLVTLSVMGALLVNPLAAYALSRYRLKRTYHILLFFLVTIAFPAEVTMIPVFLQMREFHLLNTFGALILPGLANGFSIFLLKGFFDSLPKELYEAAELDGASEWTMFWIITMNLSRPILAVIALSTFVNAYGTFFYALILAPDPQMWTLMVYIYQLRQMMDAPVVYASLILTAIPTLLVFIFCQNIILRGIVVPTEK
jgi:multiple sugar transport system permease protein